MKRMRAGWWLVLALVGGAALASPAVAQSPSPPPTATGLDSPVESLAPIASGLPSSSPSAPAEPLGEPEADVWIFEGLSLLRLDGVTGEFVSRISTDVPDCEWAGMIGPADGAIWVHSSGIPGYASPMEQAMGAQVDPEERFCIGRFALDGTPPLVFEVDLGQLELTGEQGLFITGGASLDGVLWLTAAVIGKDGGAIGGGNTALYRVDPADGSVQQRLRAVLDVAAAEGQLFLVRDERGRGFPRAARLDPQTGEPLAVDLGLRKNDSVHNVVSGDGRVVYLGLRGQGAVAYEVDGSGSLIASTRPLGRSGFGYRAAVVTSDAILVAGSDLDGIGFAPHERNATVRLLGKPCKPATRPNRPSCNASLLGTTPGAVWVRRVTSDGNDFGQAYERYDSVSHRLTTTVDAAASAVPE